MLLIDDMSGKLFHNNRKRGGSDPEYQGHLVIDGKFYYLHAWDLTSMKGQHFINIKATFDENKTKELQEV